MIDNLSLLISHGLILVTCWRLLSREDLNDETGTVIDSALAARADDESIARDA